MIRIRFKRLAYSEFVYDLTFRRISTIVDRFAELKNHSIDVTLSLKNSIFQPGPDRYSVKLRIYGGVFRNIVIEKEAMNFFSALANVIECSLVTLNKNGDRARVKNRRKNRLQKYQLLLSDAS